MREIEQLTVNWHVLEACNYDCYFCYAKYGQRPVFADRHRDILVQIASLSGKELKFRNGTLQAKSIRINFAGGEPLLMKGMTEAIQLAYSLGLNPSIITNGSLVTDEFIADNARFLSVVGFSIDSFDIETNHKIGRQTNQGKQFDFDRAKTVFSMFRAVSPETVLKVNTVVCRENMDIDMSSQLAELRPDRWKALQVIPIHGARDTEITTEQFESFVSRHRNAAPRVVVEDNAHMHRSYLMLDPNGRFYQREESDYDRSPPVVSTCIHDAIQHVEFDVETYLTRY